MAVQLVVLVICGGIAAAVAGSKGRNPIGWFFGGFFLGIIGIVIVACLSDLNQERRRQQRDAVERRRLREQLRQERMKNEAFQSHARRRLDVHDRKLGVNTRRTRRKSMGNKSRTARALPHRKNKQSQIEAIAATEPDPQTEPAPRWYFEQEGQTFGPESQDKISHMLTVGELDANTLLCMEGDDRWETAAQIACFRNAARA